MNLFAPKPLRWLTNSWMVLGTTLVITGGALHGYELAEWLVKQGGKVTFVHSVETLGKDIALNRKTALLVLF